MNVTINLHPCSRTKIILHESLFSPHNICFANRVKCHNLFDIIWWLQPVLFCETMDPTESFLFPAIYYVFRGVYMTSSLIASEISEIRYCWNVCYDVKRPLNDSLVLSVQIKTVNCHIAWGISILHVALGTLMINSCVCLCRLFTKLIDIVQ